MQKGTGADHNIFPRWAGWGLVIKGGHLPTNLSRSVRSVLVRIDWLRVAKNPAQRVSLSRKNGAAACCAGQGYMGEAVLTMTRAAVASWGPHSALSSSARISWQLGHAGGGSREE